MIGSRLNAASRRSNLLKWQNFAMCLALVLVPWALFVNYKPKSIVESPVLDTLILQNTAPLKSYVELIADEKPNPLINVPLKNNLKTGALETTIPQIKTPPKNELKTDKSASAKTTPPIDVVEDERRLKNKRRPVLPSATGQAGYKKKSVNKKGLPVLGSVPTEGRK